MPEVYDIVIVGGGPAGLGAALYGARGLHSTLVIERAGPGGMLRYADTVEDYPGLPEGISGPELGQRMWDQCTKFGTETVTAEVTGLVLDGDVRGVQTTAGEYLAKTVILATGGLPNRLGVPGEDDFRGRGVWDFSMRDYAAVAGKPVVVVGGGDTALTHALALSEVAAKVTLVHRGGNLRAFEVFQEAAEANPKIDLSLHTTVEAILGNGSVSAIRVMHAGSGSPEELAAGGVFVDIGFHPNTGLVTGKLNIQPDGYVEVDEWMLSSIPGVFAAGDTRTNTSRQAIAAAGDGCTAAIAADHYLQNAGAAH